MELYNETHKVIKAIRKRFNIYHEIPCTADDRRVQEIISIVVQTIEALPSADVVPKIEVDRLNAVMKEMDEQREYTINMLGESLEKAKADVEEISGKYDDLKLKYADLQKDKDELIAWVDDKKTEVALEIFEEIEKILKSSQTELMGVKYYYRVIVDKRIAELKKKYTGEKT